MLELRTGLACSLAGQPLRRYVMEHEESTEGRSPRLMHDELPKSMKTR